jgi:hypothetical protein
MVPLVAWRLFATIPAAPPVGDKNSLLLYGGGAVGGVFLLVVLLMFVRRGRKRVPPPAGLSEDLSAFPPAPRGRRHYQLLVLGERVRLRLVVVAPVGKKPIGKVDSVLEQVFRGLGEVSIDDKPRIRLWPAQPSSAAFAPTFFRLTRRPDPEGKPSRWILLAGPARAASTAVLLGLAVQADQPSTAGLVTLDETQWNEVLRVENA